MTDAAKWILGSWADELTKVLQFLTGEDWSVKWSGLDSGAPLGNCFWWTQPFSADPDAAIAVGAPALAWSELGARVLQAAGIELIEQASARATYIETIQQAASGLSRALTERLSRPVELDTGREVSPDFSGRTFSVNISGGEFELPPLRVIINDALCAASTPSTSVAITPKALVEATVPVAAPAAAPSAPSRTMSVLLDVQMPVSISFGRAALPLREVLKLTTGSAVELDRKPDDEVEVIVNNCVIARGEVVVVEGNYGVRITEIISREQRMALRAGGRA